MDVFIGQVIGGRYRVEAVAGHGAMAYVYQVWDKERAAFLAMKVLLPHLATNPEFLERFGVEAKALSRLQHPHIIRSYGLEQSDGLAFILMDFIEGSTLRAEIKKSKEGEGLSRQRILEIARPVCSALHFTHQNGLIHCDVKSSNILIDSTGKVFVTDFGILHKATSTAPTERIGTPAYMAPEQIRGEEPTPLTDIYAFGVMLFEMVTGGYRPFEGRTGKSDASTAENIRWEQLNLNPPSPRIYNPSVSVAVEQVILKCLQKQQHLRYQSMMQLQSALEWALYGEEPTTEMTLAIAPPTETQRNQNHKPKTGSAHRPPVIVWMLMAAVVLALVALVFLVEIPPPPAAPSQALSGMPSATFALPQTATPLNSGQAPVPVDTTYDLQDICSRITSLQGDVTDLRLCVSRITILANGKLKLEYVWELHSAKPVGGVRIGADTNNFQMYLTDNLNNRLDQEQVGGQGNDEVDLQIGDRKVSWFLFPAPDPAASSFVFHDDDNQIALPKIQKVWP